MMWLFWVSMQATISLEMDMMYMLFSSRGQKQRNAIELVLMNDSDIYWQ